MDVAVATFTHKNDASVRVFATMEMAWAWRRAIADQWWAKEMGETPKPDDPEEAADLYFNDVARYEFFEAEEYEIEGLREHPLIINLPQEVAPCA